MGCLSLVIFACSDEQVFDERSDLQSIASDQLLDIGAGQTETKSFPFGAGSYFTLESEVSNTPDENGCFMVESRIFWNVEGSDHRVLLIVSHDPICPQYSTQEDTIAIGECIDGYYSGFYLTADNTVMASNESGEFQCLAEALAIPEIKELFDAEAELVKNQLF